METPKDPLGRCLKLDWVEGLGFQVGGGDDDTPAHIILAYIQRPRPDNPLHARRGPANWLFLGNEAEEARAIQDLTSALRRLGHTHFKPGFAWITEWLGCSWLTIKQEHHNDIANIMNAGLRCGFRLQLYNNLESAFYPGEVFSRDTMEKKFVENMTVSKDSTFDPTQAIHSSDSPLLQIWNWKTAEGKEWCRRTREKKHLPMVSAEQPHFLRPWFQQYTEAHGILHHGPWGAYKPLLETSWLPERVRRTPGTVGGSAACSSCSSTCSSSRTVGAGMSHGSSSSTGSTTTTSTLAQAAATPNTKQQPEPKAAATTHAETQEERPETCIVCLERPADTRVRHAKTKDRKRLVDCCVVCTQCSRQLEKTHDKAICCGCRRPISSIAYPDGTIEYL